MKDLPTHSQTLRALVPSCEPIPAELEAIAKDVVDASIQLHMDLGPGLLESVYTVLLEKKLTERGYRVEREKPVPLVFEGVNFEMGFRADLVINGCFIVELKSVEKLAPVHAKQLLTYLRLTKMRLGLLINFGEELLKNGIKRVAN
jgi:iron complex transport system substrate-binding protein